MRFHKYVKISLFVMNNNINIPIVISYETDSNNINSSMFKKTLDKYGWEYKMIGQDIQWSGFIDKINGYYNELCILPDDKITVLSDARDVFCLRKPDFFIEKISTIIDKQIIISTELFLRGHMNWSAQQISNVLNEPDFFYQGVPLDKYWSFYNIQNKPNRKYVNSGLIVGKVVYLKKALKWILDNHYKDDQLGFSMYTNEFPEYVYLDYDAKYIHTSGGFINGSLYNHSIQTCDVPSFVELLGLSSYFLHIPGIEGSIGQKHIYKIIYTLFELNILENMFELYKLKGDKLQDIFITND